MITITSDKKAFLNIFKAVNTLAQDVTLDIQKEGIRVKALSPDHIMMVDIFYASANFEAGSVVDSAVKFGARVEDWIKAIKRFGDKLTMTVEQETVKLHSDSKSFELRTIEALDTEQDLPKIPFTVKLILEKSALVAALVDISVVSEGFTIEAGQTVTLSGKGDLGKAQSIPVVEKELKEEAKATYSLTHTLSMVEAVDCETVTLEFATRMPLKMSLDNITLYLAPRVQD